MVTESKNAKTSERTRMMMSQFMSLHNQGYSISQIAEKFNLSKPTIYKYLEQIAQQEGVSRESLLQEIHTSPAYWLREEQRVKIDIDQLSKNFIIAETALNKIISQIDLLLTDCDEEDL